MMRNKKSLLLLALFALIMAMGIGYAVVSSVTLTINGEASTVDAGDVKVVFTADTDKSSNNVVPTVTDGAITASFTASGFEKIGDEETVTFTIENREVDLSADVAVPVITNDSDYFTVTTDWDDTVNLVAGDDTTITVTVTLTAVPIEEADSTADFTITLDATPVQPTNNAS